CYDCKASWGLRGLFGDGHFNLAGCSVHSSSSPTARVRSAKRCGVPCPAPGRGALPSMAVEDSNPAGRRSCPAKDIHSSLKAMVDSPAWHLIKALDTLVSADGTTILIENYP